MKKFFKKLFNSTRWNETRTRKKMLFFSIFLIIVYTITSIIMLLLDHTLDSTLTSEFFEFAKWLVASGVAITLTDKITDSFGRKEEILNDEPEE